MKDIDHLLGEEGRARDRTAPFTLERKPGGEPRLSSAARLSSRADTSVTDGSDDFSVISGRLAEMGFATFDARKVGRIVARPADPGEKVTTPEGETENETVPGDWVATNLDRDGHPLLRKGKPDTYVIAHTKLSETYAADTTQWEGMQVFLKKGEAVVRAVEIAGGIDIVAPWGQRQQMASGYLVCNGADVYGVEKAMFEATYEMLAAPSD